MVLIYLVRHHELMMFGYVVLTLLVLVGPLAVWFGRDSRIDESARLRRFGS